MYVKYLEVCEISLSTLKYFEVYKYLEASEISQNTLKYSDVCEISWLLEYPKVP